LNWENPKVREKIYGMINWWLKLGIDGFRIGAISHIKKSSNFSDIVTSEDEVFPQSFESTSVA
jgi:glycosidase